MPVFGASFPHERRIGKQIMYLLHLMSFDTARLIISYGTLLLPFAACHY